MGPEQTSGPAPKGPPLSYTSAFAAPPEPAAPETATPAQPRRACLAPLAAALLALVVGASAAGALLSHEFWTTTRSVSAPPATDNAPGAGNGFGRGGFSFGNQGGATSSGTGGPSNASAIAAKVNPALVDITSSYSYSGGAGAGTGIVVTSNGRVLTNNHVIDGATRITATDVGNGKTYTATVVGYDPSHDIAVLQLQGASGLATAEIGDSSKLSVGDAVLGIGNAGGVGGTPSSAGGQVTGLNRSITAGDEFGGKTEPLSGLVQTNAAIQAGDSGGPLVDDQGRVIGMNTAGSLAHGFGYAYGGGGSGSAYAIPIDQVTETADEIVAGHGSDTVHVGPSAFLGVSLAPPDEGGFGFGGGSSSTGRGVQIGDVVSGQPAARAGLGAGDVITSVDGHAVSTASEVSKVMLAHHPGDTIRLAWTDSSGQAQTASVTLASGPPA